MIEPLIIGCKINGRELEIQAAGSHAIWTLLPETVKRNMNPFFESTTHVYHFRYITKTNSWHIVKANISNRAGYAMYEVTNNSFMELK